MGASPARLGRAPWISSTELSVLLAVVGDLLQLVTEVRSTSFDQMLDVRGFPRVGVFGEHMLEPRARPLPRQVDVAVTAKAYDAVHVRGSQPSDSPVMRLSPAVQVSTITALRVRVPGDRSASRTRLQEIP